MVMTTRYSGRLDRLLPSPSAARSDTPADLLDRAPPSGTPAKPTPAETLARLLDTHHWLKIRKDRN